MANICSDGQQESNTGIASIDLNSGDLGSDVVGGGADVAGAGGGVSGGGGVVVGGGGDVAGAGGGGDVAGRGTSQLLQDHKV